MGAIDGALLHLSVEKGAAADRFDTLGFGRHRHTDDWADAALTIDSAGPNRL
jgi:hypothetical protein